MSHSHRKAPESASDPNVKEGRPQDHPDNWPDDGAKVQSAPKRQAKRSSDTPKVGDQFRHPELGIVIVKWVDEEAHTLSLETADAKKAFDLSGDDCSSLEPLEEAPKSRAPRQ